MFAGAEVSTREGHFLVYGLPDLDEAPCGLALGELLKVVRRHDAAIVAAHPFRWDQDFAALVAEHGPVFDALELVSNNVTPETRRKTARLAPRAPDGGDRLERRARTWSDRLLLYRVPRRDRDAGRLRRRAAATDGPAPAPAGRLAGQRAGRIAPFTGSQPRRDLRAAIRTAARALSLSF